jgi:integrating conjugative element protein (TIGR03746 family)
MLDHPPEPPMSRFKNEVEHLKAHVKTLRMAGASLFVLAMLLGVGWWSAPKWWEVPPESVYTFAFYVFQQLNRWPTNGEDDYPRNLHALAAYLTPACQNTLQQDFAFRRDSGELRQRVRGVYEIPGRGYGDDPTARVKVLSSNNWIVTLDLTADEYFGAEQVKRALVRYTLKVVRADVDPERNPFGLALDCYAQPPERIVIPAPPSPSSAASAPAPGASP